MFVMGRLVMPLPPTKDKRVHVVEWLLVAITIRSLERGKCSEPLVYQQCTAVQSCMHPMDFYTKRTICHLGNKGVMFELSLACLPETSMCI